MSTNIDLNKKIKILDEGNQLTPDVNQIDFTGTGVTATASGNNVTVNITGSSGVWGISNASGVYTYYATLTLAMAAASAGTTIELFADVTDTNSVTIKPGVTISGNGHTYTHTNASGNTFNLTLTGTYTFINLVIKRVVGTAVVGATIFNNVGSTGFYENYTLLFQNTFVEYRCTTPVAGAGVFVSYTVGVCAFYIDGVRALSNNSAAMFSPGVVWVKNSILENTGAGACITTDNIAGGVHAENCHIKTNSGTGFGSSYANNGDSTRNCVLISTSGIGQAGGLAYGTNSFSNTSRAFSGVICYNCTARTSTGNAYYASNTYNCTGISGTGNTIIPFFSISYHYNGTFYSSGASVCSDGGGWTAAFYNCSVITDWNNTSGHAITVGNNYSAVPIFVNNYIQVFNSSANCLRGSGALNSKWTGNKFSGATTPVNANLTQAIVNTQDNQGNLLM